MNETKTLIELLEKKERLVAMLAPSFPIVYPYPTIITMLRKLGFAGVVEVAVGAKKTNEELQAKMEANPDARYITSPCPTIVRIIRKRMPEYAKYFPEGVDSPMVATAKIIHEKYPDHKAVFIGPCVMKKLEANEDYPELGILVLTFTEIAEVFSHFGISEETNPDDKFDIAEPGMTRMYPLDGGLSHSSGLMDKLAPVHIKVVSGAENNIDAIKEFDRDPKIRLLDILNCPGGCIYGPGIRSDLTKEERTKRIVEYTSGSAQ